MPQEPMPSPTRGLTDTLRSLRLAATLAHGLPGARLLVHDGIHVRAVATTHPADVPPCALRFAVRSARRTRTLEPVHDLLGLAEGVALECHLVLTDDTVTDLGGGLSSIRNDGLLGLVFATLLDPDRTRAVACDAVQRAPSSVAPTAEGHQPLRVFADQATDVSVVMGQVAIDDPGASGLVGNAHAIAAATLVEELVLDA